MRRVKAGVVLRETRIAEDANLVGRWAPLSGGHRSHRRPPLRRARAQERRTQPQSDPLQCGCIYDDWQYWRKDFGPKTPNPISRGRIGGGSRRNATIDDAWPMGRFGPHACKGDGEEDSTRRKTTAESRGDARIVDRKEERKKKRSEKKSKRLHFSARSKNHTAEKRR